MNIGSNKVRNGFFNRARNSCCVYSKPLTYEYYLNKKDFLKIENNQGNKFLVSMLADEFENAEPTNQLIRDVFSSGSSSCKDSSKNSYEYKIIKAIKEVLDEYDTLSYLLNFTGQSCSEHLYLNIYNKIKEYEWSGCFLPFKNFSLEFTDDFRWIQVNFRSSGAFFKILSFDNIVIDHFTKEVAESHQRVIEMSLDKYVTPSYIKESILTNSDESLKFLVDDSNMEDMEVKEELTNDTLETFKKCIKKYFSGSNLYVEKSNRTDTYVYFKNIKMSVENFREDLNKTVNSNLIKAIIIESLNLYSILQDCIENAPESSKKIVQEYITLYKEYIDNIKMNSTNSIKDTKMFSMPNSTVDDLRKATGSINDLRVSYNDYKVDLQENCYKLLNNIFKDTVKFTRSISYGNIDNKNYEDLDGVFDDDIKVDLSIPLVNNDIASNLIELSLERLEPDELLLFNLFLRHLESIKIQLEPKGSKENACAIVNDSGGLVPEWLVHCIKVIYRPNFLNEDTIDVSDDFLDKLYQYSGGEQQFLNLLGTLNHGDVQVSSLSTAFGSLGWNLETNEIRPNVFFKCGILMDIAKLFVNLFVSRDDVDKNFYIGKLKSSIRWHDENFISFYNDKVLNRVRDLLDALKKDGINHLNFKYGTTERNGPNIPVETSRFLILDNMGNISFKDSAPN